MDVDFTTLRDRYGSLSDEELMEVAVTADLTPEASVLMDVELRKRGISAAALGEKAEDLDRQSRLWERRNRKQRFLPDLILLLALMVIPAVFALLVELIRG